MNPQPPTDAAKTRRRYAPRMAPEQRREQLIDAALSVIVEQGYEGVSIESIARTAGVTRPVIYDHFSNLGRLLQALIEREEAYALAQLDDVVPSAPQTTGDPPALFAAGVRRFLDAVASRPDTWRIILLPPEGTPAIVREHVETNRARLLARLDRVRRAGPSQRAGIRPTSTSRSAPGRSSASARRQAGWCSPTPSASHPSATSGSRARSWSSSGPAVKARRGPASRIPVAADHPVERPRPG